ncbi:chemotaxis protein CheW [Pseudobdellovibrio exovorus]|uniref:Chemotaxis protein n=1 Tax=Pseudobdellovibrio exovorus JSS TaxID=1184267 RepID=M4VQJ0_9BACT|nr:chemotaxis protein CheW [Pseudobdellovibrio exovorus]AGH95424.1 chemotaxis protein [Pseudobdellovibrio exovorus JSS]
MSKYLSFHLGTENYAMPLLKVREVIGMPEITLVPHSSHHVLGVMNLRGQIITVIDMRTCLGLKAQQGHETTVIICEMPFGQIGMVVDAVNSVLSVAQEELAEVPAGSRASSQSYIVNIYRKEDQLTLILDVEQLISKEVNINFEALQINEAAKAS